MNDQEMIGQVVGDGRYRLISRLGSGCFGTVYRAQELLNGSYIRETALKIYSPEVTAAGPVEGMLEDCTLPARILSSDAPMDVKRHFVQIFGFGRMDTPIGECAYVSMELVRGGTTLEKIMQRNKEMGVLPAEDVILDLMRQFFTALSAAHRAGVLHRDIKGGNVMVHSGVVRLLDFGMGAWAADPNARLKTTLSIYAPENFEGKHTAASDIFQAGLMFFELYTGISPFADPLGVSDTETEKKKRREFAFLGGAHYPGVRVSRNVDRILKGCLEYLDFMRFQTADEVLAALDADDFRTCIRMMREKNYDETERIARGLLEGEELTEERKIHLNMLLSRALKGKGVIAEAIARAREAYTIAEREGLPAKQPGAWNKIIDSITVLYLQNGQSGMARLFEAKKR